MQAENFPYLKILKPIPLFVIFMFSLLLLDWFYPDFLSTFAFWVILVFSILFGFLPKQPPLEKIKTEKKVTLVELPPQIFKFKTFFNFHDLMANTIEEITIFIENLPPSSISIFTHLPLKNQRYPINLGVLLQQIKECSQTLSVHPIFSVPQKKLSFNKVEIFISIPEKKQTTLFEKLTLKANPEYKAYIDLAILLSTFKKLEKTSQTHAPYLCEIPENLFEFPIPLQILKDVLYHPNFPKHLFVLMVSPSTLLKNTALLEDWYAEGFQIGIQADKLPTITLPSFVQVFYIDVQSLRSSLKGLARRQLSLIIQALSEQPYKIILGEVEDEQVFQDILPAQFDFACGPMFGKVQLL